MGADPVCLAFMAKRQQASAVENTGIEATAAFSKVPPLAPIIMSRCRLRKGRIPCRPLF
jgi:hypothetical protein